MSYDLQFVDRIAASPTVRLDLMAAPWGVQSSTSFGMPELRRAAVSTLMADGERYSAEAYSNRVITLVARIVGVGADATAAALELLYRELDRPSNLLRWQPETSAPVFFRTFRTGPDSVVWDPVEKVVTATLPAEPFALGLEEPVGSVTVYNDPSEGTDLNANPYFGTNAASWTATGGTVARSTAQAHEGSASLLLTPDGVTASAVARSEMVPVAAGVAYRASEWVRCAVARSVSVGINWHDSSNVFISTSSASVSVAATTWTLLDLIADAPPGAGKAQITVFMTGTPPASNLLHVDEARLRQVGGSGGMCFDVSAPKGDVETPLHLVVSNGVVGTGRRRSGLAVRRRGTPSATPLYLEAQNMVQGTDTSTQPNSALMTGSGNNFSRITFSTQTGLTQRLSTGTKFPATPSLDARGTYRVFARIRQNTPLDLIDVRLRWGGADAQVSNANVRLLSNTSIKYVDLGLIQIPQGYDPATRGPSGVELATEGVFLAVDARRVTGSGTLDVDVLLLLPADDRQEYVLWPEAATVTDFVLEGGPAPAAYARNASGQIVSTQAIEIAGGGLMISPGTTNRVFFARDLGGTASGGDSTAATTTISGSYWPRYLRPATS